MTRWYKPTEKLPAHNEQILVRQGDLIELALYDSVKKVFDLRNGTLLTLADNFSWMELLRGDGM